MDAYESFTDRKTEHAEKMVKSLGETLPEFVDRATASKALAGIMSVKALANADKKGIGPSVKVKLGRKIAYERNSFLEWLKDKIVQPERV